MSQSFQPNFNPNEEPQNQPEAENLENATSRLSSTAEDPELNRRLRLVDHLLSSAPLVLPGTEFAERVMEALRRHEYQNINRYTAFGLALGLIAAIVIVVSIVAGAFLALINILINWTAVYQALVEVGGTFNGAIADFPESLNQAVSDSPVGIALSLLSLPLTFVWLRIMRRVLEGDAQ
jgi:hypothetical protein